jgi:hypothetical protein
MRGKNARQNLSKYKITKHNLHVTLGLTLNVNPTPRETLTQRLTPTL